MHFHLLRYDNERKSHARDKLPTRFASFGEISHFSL